LIVVGRAETDADGAPAGRPRNSAAICAPSRRGRRRAVVYKIVYKVPRGRRAPRRPALAYRLRAV